VVVTVSAPATTACLVSGVRIIRRCGFRIASAVGMWFNGAGVGELRNRGWHDTVQARPRKLAHHSSPGAVLKRFE